MKVTHGKEQAFIWYNNQHGFAESAYRHHLSEGKFARETLCPVWQMWNKWEICARIYSSDARGASKQCTVHTLYM